MTRLLVIEDEAELASLLQRGLSRHSFEVAVASTGAEGLEHVWEMSPDLVVLDLTLPDLDGMDVCREIRSHSDAAVVMLTARTMIGDRVRGLEAGADDYLPKPFAMEELVARIRSVLRRRSPSLISPIIVGDLSVDPVRREVTRGGRSIELTTREFDLLQILAEHAGRPVRREIILGKIWGDDPTGESDPLKVYINHLRQKLNAGGESDLVHSLRGFGYVLKHTP